MSRLLTIGAAQQARGFITEWTVSGDATARTITLPFINGGAYNCYIKWGDGAYSICTGYNVNNSHTYSSNGVYQVEIVGICDFFSFAFTTVDILKITDIIYWGDYSVLRGFVYLSSMFSGCTNLKSTGVGSIPYNNLYGYVDGNAMFFNCTNLATIRSGLFNNCGPINTTQNLFFNNKITSIPSGLFDPLINTTDFTNVFYNCTSLTAIPSNLFKYNTRVTAFLQGFISCSSLTSIPANLFDQCVDVLGFEALFANCTSLTAIPTDLFKYNTKVTNFKNTFYTCNTLATVPAELFRYNTSCLNFYGVFVHCVKLREISDIFYQSGGASTRFLNQSVDFTYAFYRDSYTGVQGTAPDLWNCSFGTGTPITSSCWGGAGNSGTSLSNYASIPINWK